jgi:hypothetical protein
MNKAAEMKMLRKTSIAGGAMVGFACIALLLGASVAWAGGLVGRPAFCVGRDGVAMTLEFSNMCYAVEATDPSTDGQGDEVQTQRGLLRATFGLAPGMDVDIALGTANLSFPDGPSDFSTFRSDWGFAWGGGLRAGYPFQKEPWQLQFSMNYLGFRAEGETANEQKILRSQYVWQELSPTLTVGYRFGQLTPFVGAMKTILFGVRETEVGFLGAVRPGLGGRENYTDGKQKPQGLVGVDYLFPDGYYLTAQVSASGQGQWGFSLGLAQALK